MSEHPSSDQHSSNSKNIGSGDCNTGRNSENFSGKEDIGSMNTSGKTVTTLNKVSNLSPSTLNSPYLIKSDKKEICYTIGAVKGFDPINPRICTNCSELNKKLNKDLKYIEDAIDKICKVLITDGDFTKSKSIWQKIGLFLGKQEQNDEDVFIKLTRILSYIESMHKALGEQEITLDERIKEIEVLKRANSNLNGQTEELKGGLTNKSRELKSIESLFHKYKEYINAMNETIRSLKIDFKEKCDQNIKLKEEIEVLREASKIKILELENINNQLEKRLKFTTENLSIAQNNLKEETRIKQSLQEKLKILEELIYVNGDKLLSEKKMFQDTLYTILDEKERFINQISINDIEMEMENHFIANTNKIIDAIMKDVQTYEDQINTFRGNYENKKYLDIREMLIRTLTRLDAIESQGNEIIQNRRRSCIIDIIDLQDKLNNKAK